MSPLTPVPLDDEPELASEPESEFNLAEYVVIGALVCASFVLVGVSRTKLGNYLALVLALLCGMAWLGATR